MFLIGVGLYLTLTIWSVYIYGLTNYYFYTRLTEIKYFKKFQCRLVAFLLAIVSFVTVGIFGVYVRLLIEDEHTGFLL